MIFILDEQTTLDYGGFLFLSRTTPLSLIFFSFVSFTNTDGCRIGGDWRRIHVWRSVLEDEMPVKKGLDAGGNAGRLG